MPDSRSRRKTYRIGKTTQERIRKLVELYGEKGAARYLGRDVRQIRNWLKGTGRVTHAEARWIGKKTNDALTRTGTVLEKVARTLEKAAIPGPRGQAARLEIGRVRAMSEKARSSVLKKVQEELGKVGPGSVAKMAMNLKKVDAQWRIERYKELATKRRKTKKENREIVALLLSLGLDPHAPETYPMGK